MLLINLKRREIVRASGCAGSAQAAVSHESDSLSCDLWQRETR
jgi:hypothetical protein